MRGTSLGQRPAEAVTPTMVVNVEVFVHKDPRVKSDRRQLIISASADQILHTQK